MRVPCQIVRSQMFMVEDLGNEGKALEDQLFDNCPGTAIVVAGTGLFAVLSCYWLETETCLLTRSGKPREQDLSKEGFVCTTQSLGWAASGWFGPMSESRLHLTFCSAFRQLCLLSSWLQEGCATGITSLFRKEASRRD
jgi:hypothetical protein